MKRLKSILCGVLTFVVCTVLLTACGTKTTGNNADDANGGTAGSTVGAQTTTTITLAEAKAIIVNALAINELKPAAIDEGNRNLLEKLGKFTLSNTNTSKSVKTGKAPQDSVQYGISGTLAYQNGDFVKYLLVERDLADDDSDELYCYYDGNQYIYNGEDLITVGTSNTSSTTLLGLFNNVKDNYLAILQKGFSDTTFASAYKESVSKVTTENGYSLTLNMDPMAFIKMAYENNANTLSNFELMWAALPEDLRNWQNASMMLTFDSHDQIVSAKVTVNNATVSGDDYNKLNTVFEVSKYTGEIAEPAWLTK